MSMQVSGRRGQKAAVALAVMGAVVGGGLSMAGGATAESGELSAGWPQASASGSSARVSAREHGADLVLQGKEVRSAEVDLGEAGESTGDFFHFEERYSEPGTRDVVGKGAARCEVGIRTYVCNGTFKVFGKGKIVVDGAFFGPRDDRLAITGGTGDFAGVGGTMRALSNHDGTSRLVFFFAR